MFLIQFGLNVVGCDHPLTPLEPHTNPRQPSQTVTMVVIHAVNAWLLPGACFYKSSSVQ